jgi:outer membrane protein
MNKREKKGGSLLKKGIKELIFPKAAPPASEPPPESEVFCFFSPEKKAFLFFFLSLSMSSANAETLLQALASAYETNPTLHAAQASQRATDETGAQARAGWRPTVSIAASAQYLRVPADFAQYQAGTIETNDGNATLDIKQPLYTGGRVTHAVRAADARISAGQQGLRATEAQIFQAAIQAYVDVLRDQTILAVRRADVATLDRQVKETELRFRLGDAVTRTDVAQTQAQREAAKAAQLAAEAQLTTSQASYRATIGTTPGQLEEPEGLPFCPHSLDDAINLAEAANPGVAQNQFLVDAAQDDVAAARSAALPTIGIEGQLGTVGPAAPLHTGEYEPNITATITLTQPLIAGGLVASQVRQALDRDEAARAMLEQTGRSVLQAVRTSFAQVTAGAGEIAADEAQVQAASLALKGYQAEYRFGLRTTLDVLIADQNLRAAQVSLAASRHDTIVAEAALLASVGRLEARTLLPAISHYDPQESLQHAKSAGSVQWEGAVEALDYGP